MFFKLLVKQNSAIGASAPVVDPVAEQIGRIAIKTDLLKSLLMDIVQMNPSPGRKTKVAIHNSEEGRNKSKIHE